MKLSHPELDRVVELLAKMPGIGRRTAQRLAFFVLAQDDSYAFELAQSLRGLKEQLRYCRECHNISQAEQCGICADPGRRRSVICVVEDAVSLANIERAGSFDGIYHVLGGALSPMHGIGPNELKIRELLNRLAQLPAQEVILATNPTVEGEATAMYLLDLISPTGIAVSRIATGIPVGGSLDYCDDVTMTKALENRRRLT